MSHFARAKAPVAMNLDLRFFFPLAALAAMPLLVAVGCNAQVSTVLSSDDASTSEGGSSSGQTGPGATATCQTDPECNHDPSVSTLYGMCVGGVCECTGDKLFDGKCGPKSKVGTPPTTPDCVQKGGTCDPNKGPHSVPDYLRPANPGEAVCANPDEVCYLPKQGRTMAPVCYNDQGCNGDSTVSSLWGHCEFGLCHCKAGYTVQLDGKCNVAPPPTCQNQNGTCEQSKTCAAGELSSAAETNATCPDDGDTVCCNAKTSCTGGALEAGGAGWVPVEFECCAKGPSQSPQPICVNGFQTCPAGTSPVMKGSICN